jgi:hypothetical protein
MILTILFLKNIKGYTFYASMESFKIALRGYHFRTFSRRIFFSTYTARFRSKLTNMKLSTIRCLFR